MIVQFDTVLTLIRGCVRLASLSLDKSSTINMGLGRDREHILPI